MQDFFERQLKLTRWQLDWHKKQQRNFYDEVAREAKDREEWESNYRALADNLYKNIVAQDIVNHCKIHIAPKKRKRKGPGRGGDRRSALFKAMKAGNPPPTKREKVAEVALEVAVELKLS